MIYNINKHSRLVDFSKLFETVLNAYHYIIIKTECEYFSNYYKRFIKRRLVFKIELAM